MAIQIMKKKMGTGCIYIKNMTRNSTIAFEDKVQYFGGKLIMMIPKKPLELSKIINYLNNDAFKNNFIFDKPYKMRYK